VRDISRLRQLESEVRRGETLAAAGQMAVGLAHEIRNPLSAIRGAVQLMQRELGDEARWGEYTAVLLKEVTRVNSIIEMLLDLGRPVTLRTVPLNVHQLLERVALLLEEEATSLGVQFVRRYDPSLPPIMADEDRIVQVFHNLVRNAIEAMPGGGRLTLVTRLSMNPLFAKVDLGQGQKSLAEIQIADEGQGMPEATRDKVFTPFFTTKDRGLGLGLALCHRIVEEHKGAIQVTSEPGRGTAVSCFLPIAK
jgi:two-component system nitrogen regulation sensor histidine kinase GlnL